MIGVSILGATGSIGVNTLEVLARAPEKFRVVALTANTEIGRLFDQCRRFNPDYAVMADPEAAAQLEQRLRRSGSQTKVLAGQEGLAVAAATPEARYVMAAIVGAAGLLPTLAAARAGKRILLANKEALVIGGRLFTDEVRAHGAELLPIDSEHNAVFQCLPRDYGRGLDAVGVRRIWLTSSGGPFRAYPLAALGEVKPQQACAHPTWVMGRKISVDSATMMNKGLEVIEACWLFDTTPDRVEVVIQPQSVIHSLVEYVDGSFLAQLASPDMRVPIAHALAWPERMESGAQRLDLAALGKLDFEAPDPERFPCLRLAYEAARQGGTAPAIMNAANEVAVQAFLTGDLGFADIPRVIEYTQGALTPRAADALATVLEDDGAARACAAERIDALRARAAL
jgi:1-deoxy-D-xylulose-5-phosphate reductoisomerase